MMEIKIDNVKISIPVGWSVRYTKSPQLFVIYSGIEVNDTFQENGNLVIEYLPREYSVKEYIDACIISLERVYKDFNIITSEGNYHIISGKINEISMQQIQFFNVKEKIAYIFTCASDPKNFTRFEDTFRKIAASLIIE